MISIVSHEQGKKRDSRDDGGHRAVSGALIASPRQEGDHFDHGVIILITFVIKMITWAANAPEASSRATATAIS
jgi:hypothetical protein